RAGIGMVLTQLVDNAVKFTPPGGRVEIRVARKGDRAHVTVSDTGPGIPDALRPRVFDAFFQVDGSDTREHGGAGLGLPIARGILAAHGIRIAAGERPGGGAVFHFSIALVRAAVTAA